MSAKAVRLNLNLLVFSLMPLLQLFGWLLKTRLPNNVIAKTESVPRWLEIVSLIALLFVGEYLYPHVAVDVLEWLKHLLLNMRAPIEQRFHR